MAPMPPHLGEEPPAGPGPADAVPRQPLASPLGQETAEHRQVLLVKGHQEFSRLAVRNLQLAALPQSPGFPPHTAGPCSQGGC